MNHEGHLIVAWLLLGAACATMPDSPGQASSADDDGPRKVAWCRRQDFHRFPPLGYDCDCEVHAFKAVLRESHVCPKGARRVKDANGMETAFWCERSVVLDEARASCWSREGPYTLVVAGRKREEGQYRKGKPHGLWSRWSEDGRIEFSGAFLEGMPNGRWTHYMEGKVHSEQTFDRGRYVTDPGMR